METTKQLFSRDLEIEVPYETPEGRKALVVRFPDDESWIRTTRKQRTLVKSLGRDKTKTELQGAQQASLELLREIVVGEPLAIDFDEYDAEYIIDKMSEVEVKEPVRTGNLFEVTLMLLPGGIIKTVHTCKIPSRREIEKFRKASFGTINLGHGQQEIRTNIRPAGELYDHLIDHSAEGYRSQEDVPIMHKSLVVSAVVKAIEKGLEAEVKEIASDF